MWWWILALVIALVVGWLLGRYQARAGQKEPDTTESVSHAVTLEHLAAMNALLRTLTSSPEISRSLFELALRIRAIVPCDRVGLALLTGDGLGYNTYTARLDHAGPSPTPQADLYFERRATIIDEVVTSRQGRVVQDVAPLASTYLDANVMHSAGFASFVLVPLVFEGAALGTLNLVARRPKAFSPADLDTLAPVAEALALAHGNLRRANALVRHEMANELSELTFAVANDMNGAVQAIIGQCELLAHETKDPAIEHELGGMLQQARRLRDILTTMQRMTREHVATSSKFH